MRGDLGLVLDALIVASVVLAGCAGESLAGVDLGRLAQMQPAEFRSLEQGAYSEFGNEGFVGQVANDSAAHQALWKRHDGSGSGRVAPKVSFADEFVVALFLGEKPTGGYGLSVVAVVYEAGRFVVAYQATAPGPGCSTTQAITNPFAFVAVARQSGQEPSVSFERVGAAVRDCA